MSESESEASAKEPGEQPAVSVLDLLYCDARRIGAFLSQFDELGVPSRVSVSESVQKARGRVVKFGASGGVPLVAKGDLAAERSASTAGQESETRDYDPLWANAFALLDYLESNELISRDIGESRIGQFVLASGLMNLMDLTLFKGIWSLPSVRESILQQQQQQQGDIQGSRQQRRAEQRRGPPASASSPQANIIDAGLALVGMLPHTIQVSITPAEGGTSVWASLRDESMVVSAADMMLKHGLAIAGEWTVMGILDALPDADENGALTEEAKNSIARSMTMRASPLGQMMLEILPTLRPMLGRPYMSYGVTPLLIYRKISG